MTTPINEHEGLHRFIKAINNNPNYNNLGRLMFALIEEAYRRSEPRISEDAAFFLNTLIIIAETFIQTSTDDAELVCGLFTHKIEQLIKEEYPNYNVDDGDTFFKRLKEIR